MPQYRTCLLCTYQTDIGVVFPPTEHNEPADTHTHTLFVCSSSSWCVRELFGHARVVCVYLCGLCGFIVGQEAWRWLIRHRKRVDILWRDSACAAVAFTVCVHATHVCSRAHCHSDSRRASSGLTVANNSQRDRPYDRTDQTDN